MSSSGNCTNGLVDFLQNQPKERVAFDVSVFLFVEMYGVSRLLIQPWREDMGFIRGPIPHNVRPSVAARNLVKNLLHCDLWCRKQFTNETIFMCGSTRVYAYDISPKDAQFFMKSFCMEVADISSFTGFLSGKFSYIKFNGEQYCNHTHHKNQTMPDKYFPDFDWVPNV